MEYLISILAGALIVEIYAWLPRISKWMLERAACRVRTEERERCREEWTADLDALPNTILKLIYALRNFSRAAADEINADFLEAKCDEIDDMLEDLTSRHRNYVQQLYAIEMKRGTSRGKVEHAVKDALSSLHARERLTGIQDEQLAISVQNAWSVFEEFGHTLCFATNRAWDLLSVEIDSVIARLDRIGGLLEIVSKKRDQISQLSHVTHSSPDIPMTLLREIIDELAVIRMTLDDDEWGDEAASRERARILDALKNVCDNVALRPSVSR